MLCVGQPFEFLATDLVGPLERTQRGHKYFLTAMCLFSKYPEALPLKTESVTEGLMEIISRHGFPATVLMIRAQFLCPVCLKRLPYFKNLSNSNFPLSPSE